jgi:hypothetical protein
MLAALASHAFKATAYFTLVLIDVLVALAIWDNFNQIELGAWLAIGGLVYVNFFMFFPEAVTKTTRAVISVSVVVIVIAAIALLLFLVLFLGLAATRDLFPWWTGIAIVVGVVVIMLFQKKSTRSTRISLKPTS